MGVCCHDVIPFDNPPAIPRYRGTHRLLARWAKEEQWKDEGAAEEGASYAKGTHARIKTAGDNDRTMGTRRKKGERTSGKQER